MFDKTLYHRRKRFCRYCSQAFSTDKVLNYFEINGKQRIKIPKES